MGLGFCGNDGLLLQQFSLRFRQAFNVKLAALEHVIELVPLFVEVGAQTGHLGERGHVFGQQFCGGALRLHGFGVFLRELFANAGDALLQFGLSNARRRRFICCFGNFTLHARALAQILLAGLVELDSRGQLFVALRFGLGTATKHALLLCQQVNLLAQPFIALFPCRPDAGHVVDGAALHALIERLAQAGELACAGFGAPNI